MEYFGSLGELLGKMNISATQKYEDFHILKFKDHLDVIPFKVEERKCNFFQIIITKDHNVDVKLGLEKVSALPASINFVSIQQTISSEVRSVEEKGIGYMLLFSPSFFHIPQSNFEVIQLFPFFNINSPSTFPLNEEMNLLFFHYMEKLYDFFQKNDVNSTAILKSYLSILLHESKSFFQNDFIQKSFHSRKKEINFQFESLIKEYSSAKHTIDFYAEKLHISPVYLAECIKKTTGKTFKKVLTEYLLIEAKSLLIHSKKSIQEIALQLGYSESGNFIALFKRNTGLTPKQYRLAKT